MKKTVFYFLIGVLLMTNLVARTVDRFISDCRDGSMQGCYQAGIAYWTGNDTVKDIKVARSLLEISCDGGVIDACAALRIMDKENNIDNSMQTEILPAAKKKHHYIRHLDGKLRADIDHDGKDETVAWRKFASVNLGDYYQLLVIDDDGSLLWKGPKKQDYKDPLVFFYLDFGLSLPQLLMDIDQDGFIELLAPVAQSDVSPTYFRKLRWLGTYFEPLHSDALIRSISHPEHFSWRRTVKSYETWVSKLAPYRNGLAKAEVTEYRRDEEPKMGTALIKFNRTGATIERWLKPMSGINNDESSFASAATHKTIGLVHGLNPYGDGFLSIRKKPNTAEIGRLYNGDKVEILGRKGKWFKIRAITSGKVGWSYSRWITTY